jgi:hypothetical protein
MLLFHPNSIRTASRSAILVELANLRRLSEHTSLGQGSLPEENHSQNRSNWLGHLRNFPPWRPSYNNVQSADGQRDAKQWGLPEEGADIDRVEGGSRKPQMASSQGGRRRRIGSRKSEVESGRWRYPGRNDEGMSSPRRNYSTSADRQTRNAPHGRGVLLLPTLMHREVWIGG